MPERLHPGVYVEEVPSPVRAIESVSTSTAAFIGVAESGPTGKPVLVTSFKEYQDKFGNFRDDSFLSYSVLNFFENGGRKCYIIRVTGPNAMPASIQLQDSERVDIGTAVYDIYADVIAEPVLTISASSPGIWGNDIDILIKDGTNDPDNEFKIVVKMGEDTLEAWDNLSMVAGTDNYVENVIGGGQSAYITVKRIASAATAAPGVFISGILDLNAKSLKNPPVADPNLNIKLNNSSPVNIKLNNTKDSSIDIAADIQAKVRASVVAVAAFEKFECRVMTSGSDERYVFISGDGGSKSSVDVTDGTPIGVLDRLKLNLSAIARTSQAVAFPGRALQMGTSKSGNEPSTAIGSKRTLSFNLNGDGFQSIRIDPGFTDGDAIAANIQKKVVAMRTQRKNPVNEAAYQKFEAAYSSSYELVFGNVDANAGTFTFVAGSGTDLTGDTKLQLMKTASTPTGGETKYGGSIIGPLPVEAGMFERERTITSGSKENFRPVANIDATITNGTIGLQMKPSAALSEITIKISLPAGLSSGTKIADVIQKAVRDAEKDVSLIPYPSTRQALKGFVARYIAYYTLKSGDVRSTDKIGPLSSVEILASPIEGEDVDVAKELNLGIPNGGIEQNGAAMLRPVNGEYHLGDNTVGGAVYAVTAGSDGDEPKDDNFIGPGGLMLLDKVDDVNIIAIPGRGSKKVVSSGLSYSTNRKLQDCFFIADMGGAHKDDPNVDANNPFIYGRDDAKQFARTMPVKSDYGAIYFPWIKAPDPIGTGKNPTRYLPPSGYMAGIYARIDSKRGVFKAPAGTEANLIGTMLPALDLAVKIDDTDQDFLNPIGVNVIRSFPASGIVSWGTRTMGSDSAWRYIPVRRLAIFMRVSIYNGIQWAVFEPNDEPLWSSLRLNVGAFMFTQFKAGAFQGSAPAQAYFVRCDSSTTTQQDIDNGVVNVLVGFAPLKPAEFVVIKISQKAGQTPQ